MADWSIGVIYAVHLKRKGASYEAKPERFMVGTPANVTDLEFAPDGCLYFTMGGRGSHGGVYRIVGPGKRAVRGEMIQRLAAWSRTSPTPSDYPLRIGPSTDLVKLAASKDADVRAQSVWMLGVSESKESKDTLLKALADEDAMVRRRACEALIRTSIEPDVKNLWPLLAEDDRFVRTAARLVLEQIDPKKWVAQLSKQNDLPAWEAIIALCKTGQAAEYADVIFKRLETSEPKDAQALLGWLRTVQLACFHVPESRRLRFRLVAVNEIAATCDKLFPHEDKLVNRELAIVLTHFGRTGVLTSAVGAKLLAAIEASTGDKQQQIHYFYCLRLLPDGWTKEQKASLARWYESTRTWGGGASYSGFLGNIFRDCLTAYDLADRKALLEQGEKLPQACLILAQRLQNDRQAELLPALRDLAAKAATKPLWRAAELRRQLDDAIVRTVCDNPKAEYYSDLLRALASSSKPVVFDALVGLTRIPTRPKPDDAMAYRAVLESARKLDAGSRWKAVELLRHWSNDKQFGAEPGQWQPELQAWSRWYVQSFPKEPALPDVEEAKPTPSKYKYDDLLDYLTNGAGKKGDVKQGRLVFEKALCMKCHRYGKEGEGLGPDLTTLSKRFKRADVLESIYYPSKVISDQYRSTTIVTLKGLRITGLAAVQGDTITMLQSDGTKVTLRKRDVEQQYASLVSVMPEKLLDALSKQEIADLVAFLESDPVK
jgi:putative heme-binding domain-containing protein